MEKEDDEIRIIGTSERGNVSGNKGLTEERVFVVFSLCMYVWCIQQGESSAELSIQVNIILENVFNIP